MTIENKLKNFILQQYSSIREFTITNNIPYSTLNSIFTRGINKATLSNVLKICDALANGTIEYITNNEPIKKEIETHEVNDILARTKKQLLTDHALMFNGKPADEESIQSILDAMEIGMEIARRKSEKK